MARFEEAIDYLLQNEGGKVENKLDPGGRTNFGICQKFYPAKDVFLLTRDEAGEWYRTHFWNISMDGIKGQRIATKLLDSQVNLGTGTANKMIQRIVGSTPDGILGLSTVGMINLATEDALLARFIYLIKLRYRDLESKNQNLIVFDRGWMARAEKLPDKNK